MRSTLALNAEQQQAVDSNSDRLLVLAGAGAGKTHTMLERIKRLVRDGVKPSSILVLTFTNAAAFEMKSRFLESEKNLNSYPEFRTFHSFCYSLLISDKNVRKKLKYDKVPRVAYPEKVKKVEREAEIVSGVDLPKNVISGEVPPQDMRQQEDLKILKKTVKKLLKEENLITFDMMITEVSDLFINNDEIIKPYRDKYTNILVDEFQDTDPRQFKFLSSFDKQSFYLCGDALQCIYQFRGCTNEFVKLFATDKEWDTIKLYNNYRSTNQICDFANTMSSKYFKDAEYRIEMKGHRDGSKVEVIPGSRSDWNNTVDENHCDILIDRLHQVKEDESIAVLCRSNREVKFLRNTLKDNNIVTATSSHDSEYYHILKSVEDDNYMIDWLSSLLNSEEYANYLKDSMMESNPDVHWFAKHYRNRKDISKYGKEIVNIRKILNDNDLDTESKVNKIAWHLKLKVAADDELSRDNIIEWFLNKLEDQNNNAIYVGTIHSSKGLEYDKVYVVGVDDKLFRLDCEDMYNLYYVACTRAKDQLTVFTW